MGPQLRPRAASQPWAEDRLAAIAVVGNSLPRNSSLRGHAAPFRRTLMSPTGTRTLARALRLGGRFASPRFLGQPLSRTQSTRIPTGIPNPFLIRAFRPGQARAVYSWRSARTDFKPEPSFDPRPLHVLIAGGPGCGPAGAARRLLSPTNVGLSARRVSASVSPSQLFFRRRQSPRPVSTSRENKTPFAVIVCRFESESAARFTCHLYSRRASDSTMTAASTYSCYLVITPDPIYSNGIAWVSPQPSLLLRLWA